MNKITKYIAAIGVLSLMGCEKYDLIPAEYNSVLLIKENGSQEVTLYTDVNEKGTFEFTVMKAGKNPQAITSAETEVMTEAQMTALGYSTNKILPAELYSLSTTQFQFGADNMYQKGSVVLNNDAIKTFLSTAENPAAYVVPIQIKSATSKINTEKNYFLLRPILLKPSVDYEVSEKEIAVNGGEATQEIFFTLPFASPWDFECTVATSTGSNLLPAGQYTIENGGKITFSKGSKRSSALRVTIKADLLGNYNLPLKISHISKEGVAKPTNDFMLRTVINKIHLTKEMLATNAQEPREGPIANMIDGNPATYFHTAWSVHPTDDAHNFSVTLANPIRKFSFQYTNRNHPNGKPKVIKILGSNDGTNFTEITTISSGLPAGAATIYTSGVIEANMAYKILRFDVTQTYAGSKYFCLAELSIFGK